MFCNVMSLIHIISHIDSASEPSIFPQLQIANTITSFTFSVQVGTFRKHSTGNTEISECMTFTGCLKNYVISYNSWREQTYRDKDMSLLYQQVREAIHFTSISHHVFYISGCTSNGTSIDDFHLNDSCCRFQATNV